MTEAKDVPPQHTRAILDALTLDDIDTLRAKLVRRKELMTDAGAAYSAIEQPARMTLEAIRKPATAAYRATFDPALAERDRAKIAAEEVFDATITLAKEAYYAVVPPAEEEYIRITEGPLQAYQAEVIAIERGERDL